MHYIKKKYSYIIRKRKLKKHLDVIMNLKVHLPSFLLMDIKTRFSFITTQIKKINPSIYSIKISFFVLL